MAKQNTKNQTAVASARQKAPKSGFFALFVGIALIIAAVVAIVLCVKKYPFVMPETLNELLVFDTTKILLVVGIVCGFLGVCITVAALTAVSSGDGFKAVKRIFVIIALALVAASIVIFILGIVFTFSPDSAVTVEGKSPLDIAKVLFLTAAGASAVGTVLAALSSKGSVLFARLALAFGVIVFFLSAGFAAVGYLAATLLPSTL